MIQKQLLKAGGGEEGGKKRHNGRGPEGGPAVCDPKLTHASFSKNVVLNQIIVTWVGETGFLVTRPMKTNPHSQISNHFSLPSCENDISGESDSSPIS